MQLSKQDGKDTRTTTPTKHQSAFSEGVPRIADDATRLARLQELYDTAVQEINEKMLGQIPEDVMVFRRKVATAVMLLVAVSFGLMFTYIWHL